mgnify:FL=1
MTLDKLARMTANGFYELRTELKGDIKGLRTELKGDIGVLGNRFDGLEMEMKGLKGEVKGLKNKVDEGVSKMLVIASGMASQFSDWKQENAFGAGIEKRQDEQLKDHEIRIKKLEKV